MAELWLRPWAGLVLSGRHISVDGATCSVPEDHSGAFWLLAPSGRPSFVNGRADFTEPVTGFASKDKASKLALFPLFGTSSLVLDGGIPLDWPACPRKPMRGSDTTTHQDPEAQALFRRVEAVWDRIGDVEDALADPIRLWGSLADRWMNEDEREPRMHPIVRQARGLADLIEALDRAPRRILRRTHLPMPIGRVQELDRRSMIWSARQPGDTLVERAGDRQRLLAVAREESYDTLENRVLRAYGELATSHAREYVTRNGGRKRTARVNRVQAFGRRCQRLARDLREKGVRTAEPDVTANFVLIENPQYRQVWDAWRELLARNPIEDELWRWQARSWEEFSVLAVVVALLTVKNSDVIAASPLIFRTEQHRGIWIDHDNPLVVLHLPSSNMVVEVQYRLHEPGEWRAGFAAPIWIRFGHVDDDAAFLANIAVWPIWDTESGLVPDETEELSRITAMRRPKRLRHCIVMRPGDESTAGDFDKADGASGVAMGVSGQPLKRGLEALQMVLLDAIEQG